MNLIRKSIFWIFVFIICVLLVSQANAQSDDDLDWFLDWLFSSLWDSDASFWFSDSDNVTAIKSWSKININFPTSSKDWTKIKKYAVRWSNVSMDDFSNTDVDYDSSSVIDEEFIFSDTDVASSTLMVTISWLSSTTIYYVTITPIASDWTNGRPSKEINFSLWWNVNDNNSTNNNSNTNSNTNDWSHSAGSTDDAISNVAYTHDGLSISMTWDDLQKADQLKISYATISNSTNKTEVWSNVRPSDETFTFSVPSANTYIVSLLPLKNWAPIWIEVHQTIHITSIVTTPSTPADPSNPIPTTPPWWPEDVLIFIVLASGAIYFLYRKLA